MYDQATVPTTNPFEGIQGGVNSGFKISEWEVTDSSWKLTWKKNNFSSRFLGNFPYLKDGNEEKWPAINNFWAKDLIAFFKVFIPDTLVDAKVKEISAFINANEDEETQKTKEGIAKGAKVLIEGLLNLATPYFQEQEFNLLLHYKMSLTPEGEEKWYLNIPLVTTKEGTKWQDEYGNYHGGFPFSVDKIEVNPNLVYVNPKPYVKEVINEENSSPVDSESEPTTFPAEW